MSDTGLDEARDQQTDRSAEQPVTCRSTGSSRCTCSSNLSESRRGGKKRLHLYLRARNLPRQCHKSPTYAVVHHARRERVGDVSKVRRCAGGQQRPAGRTEAMVDRGGSPEWSTVIAVEYDDADHQDAGGLRRTTTRRRKRTGGRGREQMIIVDVHQSREGDDRLIGFALIILDDVLRKPGRSAEVPLSSPDGGKVGTLQLQVDVASDICTPSNDKNDPNPQGRPKIRFLLGGRQLRPPKDARRHLSPLLGYRFEVRKLILTGAGDAWGLVYRSECTKEGGDDPNSPTWEMAEVDLEWLLRGATGGGAVAKGQQGLRHGTHRKEEGHGSSVCSCSAAVSSSADLTASFLEDSALRVTILDDRSGLRAAAAAAVLGEFMTTIADLLSAGSGRRDVESKDSNLDYGAFAVRESTTTAGGGGAVRGHVVVADAAVLGMHGQCNRRIGAENATARGGGGNGKEEGIEVVVAEEKEEEGQEDIHFFPSSWSSDEEEGQPMDGAAGQQDYQGSQGAGSSSASPGYRFGDITNSIVAKGKKKSGREENSSYRFGDFTRGLFGGGSDGEGIDEEHPSPQPVPATVMVSSAAASPSSVPSESGDSLPSPSNAAAVTSLSSSPSHSSTTPQLSLASSSSPPSPAWSPRRPQQILPTMDNYLRDGFCDIDMCVAIDFTEPNGDYRQRGTRHYLDPQEGANGNDYERSLAVLGDAFAEEFSSPSSSSSQDFSVWGFGAQFGQDGPVRNLFQCGTAAAVRGAGGMVDAYRETFVAGPILSGRANYCDVIQRAASGAVKKMNSKRLGGKVSYTVLVILTLGDCDAFEAVQAKLDVLDNAPISIVFVCLDGHRSYSSLLEAMDVHILEGGRSVLTFLDCGQIRGSISSRSLARDAFRQVPEQMTEYFVANGIHPPQAADK